MESPHTESRGRPGRAARGSLTAVGVDHGEVGGVFGGGAPAGVVVGGLEVEPELAGAVEAEGLHPGEVELVGGAVDAVEFPGEGLGQGRLAGVVEDLQS